jgi:hypothetical protein
MDKFDPRDPRNLVTEHSGFEGTLMDPDWAEYRAKRLEFLAHFTEDQVSEMFKSKSPKEIKELIYGFKNEGGPTDPPQ